MKESERVFSRNVDFASLQKGQLNFDDKVEQDYDVKSFSSNTTPVQALAVGRVVVDFVDEAKETEMVDLSEYENEFVSATGELWWLSGNNPRDGDLHIDTPRTQAWIVHVVGAGASARLEDVTICAPVIPSFTVIYVTSLDDTPIATSKHLLITTIARARNTDMKMIAGTLIKRGKGPILMEPVVCDIRFNRKDIPTVHILDHDGRRTGRFVEVGSDGIFNFDGRETRAVYYEVEF